MKIPQIPDFLCITVTVGSMQCNQKLCEVQGQARGMVWYLVIQCNNYGNMREICKMMLNPDETVHWFTKHWQRQSVCHLSNNDHQINHQLNCPWLDPIFWVVATAKTKRRNTKFCISASTCCYAKKSNYNSFILHYTTDWP